MKKYLSILRNSPFFKGLSDSEILSILHCVNAVAISRKRDSYIFRAGDATEVMGLVVFRKISGDIGIFCQNAVPVISLASHMQQAQELF